MQLQSISRSPRAFLTGRRLNVDWQNALTTNLIGCYVPGTTPNAQITNLAGYGADLATQSASAYFPTAEGPGMSSLVANQGAFAIAPPIFKPAATASIFWRGMMLGNTASQTFIGVNYNSTGDFPFLCYSIQNTITGGNFVRTFSNSGGAFVTGPGVTYPLGKMISLTATFQQGGNAVLYFNGVQVATVGFGSSAISYTATSNVALCCFPGFLTRTIDGITTAGMIWNRVLSPAEILNLHLKPYQFLVDPSERVFSTVVGVSTIAANQTHRHGVAG